MGDGVIAGGKLAFVEENHMTACGVWGQERGIVELQVFEGYTRGAHGDIRHVQHGAAEAEYCNV